MLFKTSECITALEIVDPAKLSTWLPVLQEIIEAEKKTDSIIRSRKFFAAVKEVKQQKLVEPKLHLENASQDKIFEKQSKATNSNKQLLSHKQDQTHKQKTKQKQSDAQEQKEERGQTRAQIRAQARELSRKKKLEKLKEIREMKAPAKSKRKEECADVSVTGGPTNLPSADVQDFIDHNHTGPAKTVVHIESVKEIASIPNPSLSSAQDKIPQPQEEIPNPRAMKARDAFEAMPWYPSAEEYYRGNHAMNPTPYTDVNWNERLSMNPTNYACFYPHRPVEDVQARSSRDAYDYWANAEYGWMDPNATQAMMDYARMCAMNGFNMDSYPYDWMRDNYPYDPNQEMAQVHPNYVYPFDPQYFYAMYPMPPEQAMSMMYASSWPSHPSQVAAEHYPSAHTHTSSHQINQQAQTTHINRHTHPTHPTHPNRSIQQAHSAYHIQTPGPYSTSAQTNRLQSSNSRQTTYNSRFLTTGTHEPEMRVSGLLSHAGIANSRMNPQNIISHAPTFPRGQRTDETTNGTPIVVYKKVILSFQQSFTSSKNCPFSSVKKKLFFHLFDFFFFFLTLQYPVISFLQFLF